MQASPKTDGKIGTAPGQTDRELIQEFLGRMAFDDRWKPVAEELQWVLGGRKNPKVHKKLLPGYCYEILDVWRRTLFKNFPTYEDTIRVTGAGKSAQVT